MQGLADTFIILGMAFDSPEAKQLNKDIFECIYYNALVTSCTLAKVDGECTLNKPDHACTKIRAYRTPVVLHWLCLQ